MDTLRAREALKILEEFISKQEQKDLEELEKDIEQDPVIEEFETQDQETTYGKIEFSDGKVIRILDPDIKPEPVPNIPSPEPFAPVDLPTQQLVVEEPEEEEEELEVFVDGSGNRYTENLDGTKNYI